MMLIMIIMMLQHADEAPSAMIFTASLIHMMDGGEAEAEANHR